MAPKTTLTIWVTCETPDSGSYGRQTVSEFQKTQRTTIKRLPARGIYDREQVYSILDEGFICHLGYVAADGSPFVIPTAYGRDGDRLYVHGSAISRTLDTVGAGIPVCITITIVDGMVFARSAFHHSMNYRSVMIFGTATPIRERTEKLRALATITNHLIPGRWEETRETTDVEANASQALSIPLEEVSAKVRAGGPHDDAEDLPLPIWAGVIPLAIKAGAPLVSEQSDNEVATIQPDSIQAFIKKHAPRT
jgi:uncharacterized protein